MTREGYFSEGDYIEVSGKLRGLVVHADSKEFHLQRTESLPSDDYLTNQIEVYSNEPSEYVDKYWIKKLKQPARPLKHMSLELFAD